VLPDGVDVRTLAEYLGHSGPAFTLRVYCHLMPDSPDRVRQAIDRAFSQAPDHPEITQESTTSL
jgi:site-specific recombinase XerD